MLPFTREQAEQEYGKIVDGKWADEVRFCGVCHVSDLISKTWKNSYTGASTSKIYCNRDLIEPLEIALHNVIQHGLIPELKTFDGCYTVRSVRGEPDKWSWHSYGLAIDINAKENPLGGQNQLSQDLIECFLDAGFIWGGSFQRKDPQHFQYGIK